MKMHFDSVDVKHIVTLPFQMEVKHIVPLLFWGPWGCNEEPELS